MSVTEQGCPEWRPVPRSVRCIGGAETVVYRFKNPMSLVTVT